MERIEGRKFCVVFVKTVDEVHGKVQLQCMRGRASVDRGKVSIIDESGCTFTVPGTAVKNILPSDGTALLKDAEFFCFVKVDPSIQLVTKNDDDLLIHDIDDDDECDCGHEHHHHGECDCGHDHPDHHHDGCGCKEK
ncbi:MAG: hypothetical protein IKP00_02050 [Victivallales bacterium]|nr:hypothetical protein [Victivallales bacterium]